ncbi:hypothetical protein [Streptomyces sp. NPDC054783]
MAPSLSQQRHARPDGGSRPVGWRLIGANNRELGRCAATFESLAACQAAVNQLRERIADVRPVLAMAHIAGTWTWRVALDGQNVATSGRPYQRHRECQHNLGLFLAALPVAELSSGLVSLPRLRGLHVPGPVRPVPPGVPGTAPPDAPGERADPLGSTVPLRIQAGAGTP